MQQTSHEVGVTAVDNIHSHHFCQSSLTYL